MQFPAQLRLKMSLMKTLFFITLLVVLGIGSLTAAQATAQAIPAPILKWQRAGCFSSWCETGWYSSPAVADLDNDGAPEVIASAYSIVVLDGATGALRWRVKSGFDRSKDPDTVENVGRTWPGIIIADVDGNGSPEIVTAHGGGWVAVYSQAGYFLTGWPQKITSNEVRGVSVYDLDGDGSLEIIATGALGSKTNAWVLEHTGAIRPGWPQLSNDSGYAWGVYNANAAIADLNADGAGEIIIPSDVHYIAAYAANGVQLPANPIYGNKAWGKVGVHVDHNVDLRGYANCGSEHRPNFANSPATIADVDDDGVLETIVVGNVYNCGTNPYTDLYEMPFIFRRDRTRWASADFDWTAIPTADNQAAPISEDYNVIESSLPNPVAADLDGDGQLEILYPSYDGRVHAYWLDKTEHGSWPYRVYQPNEGFYRFASEPAVADLDNNGRAEVLFVSWVQKGSNRTGKLHILADQGNVLHEVDLPTAFGNVNWNGALAAPTLANLDSDADLELVINTAHSGFVAYDLPGTANARILWGTARGSYGRNGVAAAVASPGTTPTATPVASTPNPTPTPAGTPTLIPTAFPAGNNQVFLSVIKKEGR